jgi:hypothetical protein
MSIILAIEPDRRRASQLTGMARAHLRAELLVAPTAAQAVDMLDGRVPDVLLTAPLLPSQEEAAMAEYLRQLGPSAAHVQTLTIPLLAGGADRDRPVLSAFRRDKNRSSRSEPEGCDPAVFAEQITEYLREARERRDAPQLPPRPAPAVETTPVPRLATAKNGTIARLLAAAVEEEPDDFREFLLPPAPSIPLEPPADEFERQLQAAMAEVAGEVAPDIKFSRANDSFTSDGIPTFEPDGLVTADNTSSFRTDALESVTSAPVVTFTAGQGESASFGRAPAVSIPSTVGTPGLRRRARRAQSGDGWGFFDPSQCAFPALIAKLDEIASRESDG